MKIQMLFDGSKLWGMKINIDKTKFMSISKSKNIVNFNYSIDGQNIDRVFTFCDQINLVWSHE